MLGTEVSGVAGFDFLKNYKLTLDYYKAEIHLRRSDDAQTCRRRCYRFRLRSRLIGCEIAQPLLVRRAPRLIRPSVCSQRRINVNEHGATKSQFRRHRSVPDRTNTENHQQRRRHCDGRRLLCDSRNCKDRRSRRERHPKWRTNDLCRRGQQRADGNARRRRVSAHVQFSAGMGSGRHCRRIKSHQLRPSKAQKTAGKRPRPI